VGGNWSLRYTPKVSSPFMTLAWPNRTLQVSNPRRDRSHVPKRNIDLCLVIQLAHRCSCALSRQGTLLVLVCFHHDQSVYANNGSHQHRPVRLLMLYFSCRPGRSTPAPVWKPSRAAAEICKEDRFSEVRISELTGSTESLRTEGPRS
jgi:hypothetical protein